MDKILNSLIGYLEFEKKHFKRNFLINEDLIRDDSQLEEDIMNCRKCGLHLSAKNKVIGSGNANADIMLVGEAPGEEEDKKGVPFVGKAGEKLEEMLKFISLTRDDVFICNVLKCRPPHNADPSSEQEKNCIGYLKRQISMVKPKIILTLGRHASSAVTGNESKNMYDYLNKEFIIGNNVRVIATYHPAAILYSKGEAKDKIRRQVAEDLKRLQKAVGEL